MNLGNIMKVMGILGYLALAATAVSGMLKAKIGVHKALAITAVLLITVHAGFIVYFILISR